MGACLCKSVNEGGATDDLHHVRQPVHRNNYVQPRADVPWENRNKFTKRFQSDCKLHLTTAKLLKKSRERVQRQQERACMPIPGSSEYAVAPPPVALATYNNKTKPNEHGIHKAVAEKWKQQKKRREIEMKIQQLHASLPHRPQNMEADTNENIDVQYSKADLFNEGNGTPNAPLILAQLYERAFENMDGNWASQASVACLMDMNIHYVSPEKMDFRGRRSVCDKLNEAMQGIFNRIGQVAGNNAAGLSNSGIAMQMEGPSSTESGTWIMQYSINVSVMKVTIIDEYTISDDGLIQQLVRKRKNGLNMSEMLGGGRS